MTIREIRPDDVPAVVGLVRELAEYEKALDEVRLTEEQLTAALFGDSPALFGHVAVAGDGAVVGTALWFLNFSTWRGTHGIYLEDLYVQPAHRGTGPRPGAAADARRGLRPSAGTAGWSGRCSTGTRRPSTSTRPPGPCRWTSGRSSG